jgi:hypothetical protein
MPASTLTTPARTVPSPAILAAASRTLRDDLDDLGGFLESADDLDAAAALEVSATLQAIGGFLSRLAGRIEGAGPG